jgi:hypothetical protein
MNARYFWLELLNACAPLFFFRCLSLKMYCSNGKPTAVL